MKYHAHKDVEKQPHGTTSNKIPIKKGHRSIHDAPIPYFDHNEYIERNFAENYGFKKQPPGRSPVSDWEHAHILRETEIGHVHHVVKDMVKGKPSGFKTHDGHRHGALRMSGHHKAHQVGKR